MRNEVETSDEEQISDECAAVKMCILINTPAASRGSKMLNSKWARRALTVTSALLSPSLREAKATLGRIV